MNRRQLLGAVLATGAGLAGAAGCGSAQRPGAALRSTPAGRASVAGVPDVLPPELAHGRRDRPNVALTFHGQGDPRLVDQLLAELAAGGARVTVLGVGTWLSAQPALVRRILDGGHELGNHTEHHRAIARMSAPDAFAEIDGCARTLLRLTGSIGRWFRPSQTPHSTPMIRAQARRAGYQTCLSYDIDSLDYTDPPPAAVVRTVLSAVTGGSVVSMHCGHTGTIAAIAPILAGLHARGLRAVTVSEMVAA